MKEIEHFDEKADLLWDKVKGNYIMIALRNQHTLNILYSQSTNRFIKIEVFCEQKYIGWAVFLITSMDHHKQFGSMRVATVVDCLAHPDNALKVLKVAKDYLLKYNVDIVVANHSHEIWGKAFKKLSFIQGPSNFLFAASRNLSKLVNPFELNKKQIYFMRGDGDGPINL